MARDPYIVLGVERGADADRIRSAYRKLAKENHPDRNPGDDRAEERFKEASAAFGILGDKDKRARFDRGEIDADGRPKAPEFEGFRRGGPQGPGGYGDDPFGGGAPDGFGDIFADLFGGGRRRDAPRRGRDVKTRLSVDFLDAVRGATRRVGVDGRTLDLAIPAGVKTGQTLRLKGQGEPGALGGPAGDVYVDVTVKDHPTFARDGDDVRMELPISLREAVLGAKVKVSTPTGEVVVSTPKNASSGVTLRLAGRGVQKKDAPGALYVRLKIVLPPGGDPDLEAFVKSWSAGEAFDPRA